MILNPFSLQNYIALYPFSLVDIYLPLIILIWLMGLSIVFILFSAFPSRSKYSMLGCIRIIPQLISLELIWTTIILIFIRSFNSLSIASYRYSISFAAKGACLWLVCYRLISNNHLFLIPFFICILGESNRVPHDLPEAEPESYTCYWYWITYYDATDWVGYLYSFQLFIDLFFVVLFKVIL